MNFNNDYHSVFDSKYSVPQWALSAPTSIQTANQLSEATARLNAGVFGVDLAPINPDIFEQVPREHFKEIDRLAKLSDAKATIHGPIVDLTGFAQNKVDELKRKQTEEQLSYFLDRAHDLDPDGNTPINFHVNTQIPSDSWRKLSEEEYRTLSPEEKKCIRERGYGHELRERMGIINKENGQINIVEHEVKHYPGRKEVWTPERRLISLNQTEWDQEKLRILNLNKEKNEVMERLKRFEEEDLKLSYAEKQRDLNREEMARRGQITQSIDLLNQHIGEYDQHIRSGLNELYNKFDKFAPDDTKKTAKQQIAGFTEFVGEYGKFTAKNDKLREQLVVAARTGNIKEFERLGQEAKKLGPREELLQDQLMDKLMKLPTAEVWKPTNEVAKEKTAETVANVAFSAYKKYGEHTPILTLENYYQDLALGSADDLRKTIEESRKKFVDKLIKEKNIGIEEAKKTADKLIGVTWDVGHINFMRRHGYSEKEILKETEKIAPLVKQLHITDNFGFSDAHMPPGMGNAPIKEEIEVLKKKGFKFEKGNVIVEAGAFPAQFKENPHGYALEYFKSPLYTLEPMQQPYWPQVLETQGSYFSGYGQILPDVHFRDLYGAGFSNLPPELGGQRGGEDKGRFAQG